MAPRSLIALASMLSLAACFDVDPAADTDNGSSGTAGTTMGVAESSGPDSVSATSVGTMGMGSGTMGNPTTAEDDGTTRGPADSTDDTAGETEGETEGGEVECGARGEIQCGDDVVVGGELCLGAPIEAATGANISSLAVFDFDADGIDDLLVGQQDLTNALLLRGGPGGLTQIDDVSFQWQQRDIAGGDFTGDGVADVLSLGSGDRRLTLRRGDGTGAFAFVPHVAGDADFPSAMAVGDLNGDDRTDVAIVYWTRVVVYLSDAMGIPSSPIEYEFPGELEGGTSIALADIDGSNGLDITVGTYDTGTFGVMFNNGAASFSDPQVYETAPGGSSDGASWIRAADINQDDRIDILVDDFNFDAIYPHITAVDGVSVPGTPINTWGLGGFQLADFDDDCAPDLAAHESADDSIRLFTNRNDGSGTFTVPENLPFGAGSIRRIDAGDFNGDGVMDLVVASPTSVSAYYSNP